MNKSGAGIDDSLRLRRPDLVVDQPFDLVLRFFAGDQSSVGARSYDAYVSAGLSPPNRVVAEDVTTINTTMSARSPHADWANLIARGELPELAAVDPTWDVFLTPDKIWKSGAVPDRLAALFRAVIGKGVHISRATKVLHIKRPRLIPVCDSYVLGLMGIPGDDGASGVALIEHLHTLRAELLPRLLDLQTRLRERGYDRTLVRIADGLIWSSYPDTWLGRRPSTSSSPRKATA